jgi:glycosyltransferase involved in cell wall biosynthesis
MGVLRLAQWMSSRGWDAVLYAVSGSPLLEASLGKVSCVPIRKHSRHGDAAAAMNLGKRLRGENTGTLLLFDARDLELAALVKCIMRGRLSTIYYQNMRLGIPKRDPLHTFVFRRLDAWIAPLEYLADEVRANCRIRPDHIHIIPHGIEIERFASNAATQPQARDRFGLPADAFVFGLTGRIDAGKGQHVLIDALHLLHDRYPQAHCLFVGDPTAGEGGPYLEQLRGQAHSYGLDGHVHFVPFQPDIETAYRAMDVFVLGTQCETFGMVSVEAMLSGVPVIATNAGGTPEVLGDGRYGILYPPGSSGALADHIAGIIDDPRAARALAEEARNYARERFSHVHECECLEKLIALCLNAKFVNLSR